MINHRGGISIFGQILSKTRNWNFEFFNLAEIENLKSALTLAQIQILDP